MATEKLDVLGFFCQIKMDSCYNTIMEKACVIPYYCYKNANDDHSPAEADKYIEINIKVRVSGGLFTQKAF